MGQANAVCLTLTEGSLLCNGIHVLANGPVSVCLSICQAGTASKRLTAWSCFLVEATVDRGRTDSICLTHDLDVDL